MTTNKIKSLQNTYAKGNNSVRKSLHRNKKEIYRNTRRLCMVVKINGAPRMISK